MSFNGIDHEDADDITQDLIMQFIAGDYLRIYSPEKQSYYAEARYQDQLKSYEAGEIEHKPERFSGKFSSFVWEFVRRRLMGMRDKSNRVKSTMRSLDYCVEVSEAEDAESSLLIFFGLQDAQFQNVELRQWLQRFYKMLVEMATPTTTRNFPELFESIIDDAFHRPEGFSREAYAQKKNITVSAVSMQLRELRLHLEQNGFYKDLCQMIHSRHKSAS